MLDARLAQSEVLTALHGERGRERSPIDIVAIVGSAGGSTGLRKILAHLPANFPAPILYLQHLAPDYQGSLVDVLQYSNTLEVRWAEHGDTIRPGVVYVCPAGHVFLIHADGTIVLAPTATHRERLQAGDRFLQSVAAHFAGRAMAIVLSGATCDGAAGVRAVHAQRGMVLVQDEVSALIWGMPKAAFETGCVDIVVPLHEMSRTLVEIVVDGHPLPTVKGRLGSARLPVTPAMQALLARFLDTALNLHCTDLGNVQVVDPTGALVIVAQRGFRKAFLDHFRTVRVRENSACGRAMRSRAPVLIEDVTTDPLFAAHRDIAAAAGFRAVQSTPLISRWGTVLGVLSTHFRTPRRFSPREFELTVQHGKRVAAVLERALIG